MNVGTMTLFKFAFINIILQGGIPGIMMGIVVMILLFYLLTFPIREHMRTINFLEDDDMVVFSYPVLVGKTLTK